MCIVLSVLVVWCTQPQAPEPEFTLDLSNLTYSPIQDPQSITVNNTPITISNRLASWSRLQDLPLDKAVDVFDKIETIKLSDLSWYTLIYSVPSLDTPVCTLQTKQIEAAAKNRPNVNFVIISHDTPFALDRFCSRNDINNIVTLSDSRRKNFAKENGLYMQEYDLMTRAVMIVDDNLNVVYLEYAAEVTSPVDLLNALAALDTMTKSTP